jgi:hypothetical protein
MPVLTITPITEPEPTRVEEYNMFSLSKIDSSLLDNTMSDLEAGSVSPVRLL